ncbi:NS1 [Eqcopivirus EqCoPV_A4]|nr:NS1 [Eqcopivirus EqCoPV_A4]
MTERFFTAVYRPWTDTSIIPGYDINRGELHRIQVPLPTKESGQSLEEGRRTPIYRQVYALWNILQKHLWKCSRGSGGPRMFAQLECKDGFYHAHFAFSTHLGSPRSLRTILQDVEQDFCQNILGITQSPKLFEVNKNGHGAWTTGDSSFITGYLGKKLQPEYLRSWTTMPEYTRFCEDYSERLRMNTIDFEQDGEFNKDIGWNTSKGTKLKSLVTWLTENAIISADEWRDKFQDIYYSYIATPAGTHMAKIALDEAKHTYLKCRPLACIGANIRNNAERARIPKDATIRSNKIFQLLDLHDIHIEGFACMMWYWGMRELGKRNSIWLSGHPSVGNSNLAGAIARQTGPGQRVNGNSEHFPFQDCREKAIGWWDEGALTNKNVEAAKALTSGQTMRIDIKCKPSEEIVPPPMIITSNWDMTLVQIGSTISGQEAEAMKQRLIKVELTRLLPNNWGLIKDEEVEQWWRYGAYTSLRWENDRPQFVYWMRREMPWVLFSKEGSYHFNELILTAEEEAELEQDWELEGPPNQTQDMIEPQKRSTPQKPPTAEKQEEPEAKRHKRDEEEAEETLSIDFCIEEAAAEGQE